MKPAWSLPLLLGLGLGMVFGSLLSPRLLRPANPKGTAFLRELSFADLAVRAGPTNWTILEDRIYEPFPALGRSPRIARRIVARADVSGAELDRFVTGFHTAVSSRLDACQALNQAQFDLVQDSTQLVGGVPVRLRLDLPRRYYAIGDVHGVADLWYLAESGHVTAIISLIEGP